MWLIDSMQRSVQLLSAGVVAWVWCSGHGHLAAQCSQTPSVPRYSTTQAEQGARDALSRPVDPDLASRRSAVDSRIMVLDANGSWKVQKQGSFGYSQQTATVIDRTSSGQLVTTQKGTGIKNSNLPRFASDMRIVTEFLGQAQKFTYCKTEYWGRPEDLEKAQKGDCADKSFWLASKLIQTGMQGVRVVCGKRPEEAVGHAWVEVPVNGESYILETTTQEPPKLKSQHAPLYYSKYPPMVFFDRSGAHTLVQSHK